MEYREVVEARGLPGLKLVLTCHVPGPWGESAKKIFEYKKVPYVPVAQHAGGANADLVSWTGIRNAPIAIYEDDPPKTGWYDILMLAERLAPERPLLPASSEDRALVIGISAEICSEWGFGWARRAMMGTPAAGQPDPERIRNLSKSWIDADGSTRMRAAYGKSVGGSADAPSRCADILRMLAARLHRQKEANSPYLVGHSITACDIYWTVFSMALEPLPHAVNPMPDWMRIGYEMTGPVIAAVKDPILLDHRDYIYRTYLPLPLDF